MKAKTFRIICILFLIQSAFTVKNSFGQWEPDVRLTNDGGISYPSYNNAWNIAANGDTVHIVWFDKRNNNYYAIYYKRSIDKGLSWGEDIALTDGTVNASLDPSIAVSGNVVHVVWHDGRDVGGGYELYYKRSTDGGLTWETELRLTNAPLFSGYASLAVSGNIVHLTWYDERDGNYEVYYKRSTDGGLNWEADTRLTNNPGYSWSPSISVSGNLVHVVWFNDLSGNEEIYYKRSTDGGFTWEEEIRLTNDPAFSDNTSIAVSGNDVHVVWMDNRDGNFEIYYLCSTDGGLNWESEARLTFFSGSSYNPSITCYGLNLHCVWYDNRDGNYEIYYKRSTDSGITWEEDFRLTEDPASSGFPSIAVADTILHVVWQDDRDGNLEIYYKRNLNGNPVTGISNFPPGNAAPFSLGQNYPNPFNPSTKIKFTIPAVETRHASFQQMVTLMVYDVLGNEISTLVNEEKSPGTYEVEFNTSSIFRNLFLSVTGWLIRSN
jgi:hypothetical protein